MSNDIKQPYPPTDAFPNCKGLSAELGLTRADKLPQRVIEIDGVEHQWYSICSRHRDGDIDCNICRVGRYVVFNESEAQ